MGEQDISPKKQDGAVPLYRRADFWFLSGILLGIASALLYASGFFSSLRRSEAPAAPSVAVSPDTDDAETRSARLRAGNRGLEDEVRRLKSLLREDPCALPGLLGKGAPGGDAAPPPDTGPALAGTPPDSPAGTPPDAAGTPPDAAAGSDDAPAPRPDAAPSGLAPPAAVPAEIADLLTGATVFVVSSYNGTVGMGSGFFVAPGLVATNRHVVQSPQARVIVGNKALGGMLRAVVVAFSDDEDRDFALLKVDGERAAAAPVLRIARGAARTERVSAWGFPGYIAAIDPKLAAMAEGDIQSVPDVVYSEGVVSVVLDRNPPVILHTASLSQGNSGGPLVDSSGSVVGINTFIRQADQSYSQTNIALPGSELAAFMRAGGFRATGPE
jgi:S1-C subfamily serine protease